MAASIVVPARDRRAPRAVVARAAARSAPWGPGLATVVPLPVRGSAVAGGQPARVPSAHARPALRVVAPVVRRRTVPVRLVVLGLVALLVVGVAGGLLRGGLVDAPEPVAAGHVVLQPGETLWDVAVRSAPAGVDPRRQLDTLRRLNGFGPGALDAWTVVLIPAV